MEQTGGDVVHPGLGLPPAGHVVPTGRTVAGCVGVAGSSALSPLVSSLSVRVPVF